MNQEQQTVILPSNNNAMVANSTCSITIPKGVYDIDQTNFVFALTYDIPAASQILYYRQDFQTCFQTEFTAYKDGELIQNLENHTDCQALIYNSFYYENNKNFSNVASYNLYNDQKIKYLQTGAAGGAAQLQYIQTPARIFLPFICLPNQKYLVVHDVLTLQITLLTLNVLINKSIADATQAAFAITSMNISITACQIPDIQIPPQIQSCVQSISAPLNAQATSQQFNFKVKKNVLSQFQGFYVSDSGQLNVINYGRIAHAQLFAANESSTKLKKNGNKQLDPKIGTIFVQQNGVQDFIEQLNSTNLKKGCTQAAQINQQAFKQTSINFRFDTTGAGLNATALFQYIQEPELM